MEMRGMGGERLQVGDTHKPERETFVVLTRKVGESVWALKGGGV